MREIKGYPILAGARGGPRADVDALARAMSRLSLFAAANADTLTSVDMNLEAFRRIAAINGCAGEAT